MRDGKGNIDDPLAMVARLEAERTAAAVALARADVELERAYAAASRSGAAVNLLKWIEAHCRASGVAPSTLGAQVLDDPRFVSDLRAGRTPRRKTEARVRAYLEGVR